MSFKNGCYYTLKVGAKWVIFHNSPLGVTTSSVEYINNTDRLRYYNGILFLGNSTDKGIKVNEEHFDLFERCYKKEDLKEWKELRLQYAGQAMQALIRINCNPIQAAKRAFEFADEMINVLKEEVAE